MSEAQGLSVWDAPLTQLKGVGPKLAEKLTRLNLFTLQDILFHLPHRYQDRTRIASIANLTPGSEITTEGVIQSSRIVFGRRRSLICQINDHSGLLTLRFFHFSRTQKDTLKPGAKLRCFGEVRRGATSLEMIHPEYTFVSRENPHYEAEQSYTPIFPSTQGISQSLLRNLVQQALKLLEHHPLSNWLPMKLLPPLISRDLVTSLKWIHFPPADMLFEQLDPGKNPNRRRLAFEELIAHRLAILERQKTYRREAAFACPKNNTALKQLTQSLSFSLTSAQQRVIHEINNDLAGTQPMQRLLQGDVGSGKTLVAATAILQCIKAGYQAALMVPTEILAEQHTQSFTQWFEPMGIKVATISGQLRMRERNQRTQDLQEGQIDLVIGTHALFQADVHFKKLALIVIDEQHRFGVDQRLALRQKGGPLGQTPHQLIMTATPIPRTLAMTLYADLDCSVIDELPPGRQAIKTVVMPESRRDALITRIREALTAGTQVYWVCTLIDESEALQCQTAEKTAEVLQSALPGSAVGLLHGRMKPDEKETIMTRYKSGDIQLLVATTVIEVGVNVPNASLMVIENAERLGLSQLHQLRGRVGRGNKSSSCVLLYQGPLTQTAKERLAIMRETNDGFKIAEKDLEIRGSGELMGVKQTGVMQFRIADLRIDAHLLDAVQATATHLQENNPDAIQPLIRRWLKQTEVYVHV